MPDDVVWQCTTALLSTMNFGLCCCPQDDPAALPGGPGVLSAPGPARPEERGGCPSDYRCIALLGDHFNRYFQKASSHTHTYTRSHKIVKWTMATEAQFLLCVCVLYPYSCWSVYVCVTSRVSDSVEKNRRQLQSITDRIRLAEARVNKIKGSKKATKVRQRWQLYMLRI